MKIFRQITANNIQLTAYPFFREIAMEAYLLENEEVLSLDTNDFEEVTILDAEIALKAGRKSQSKNGRIDILAQYGADYLGLIEIKKDEIKKETLIQLEDYLAQKEQIIKKHPTFWENKKVQPKWVGIMVGSSIDPELQALLQNGHTINGIPIAGMVIRRFRNTNNEIFIITDTFFKYNYSNKDYSKFRFKGVLYNKSRLVNAVIKAFVAENQGLSYAKLEKKIPQHLQGTMGVFKTVEQAQEIYNKTTYKRHYLKPEEVIQLSDIAIATCNQWGVGNIEHFIAHINKFGKGWIIENI